MAANAALPDNQPRSREEQRNVARAHARMECTADKFQGGVATYQDTLSHLTTNIGKLVDRWPDQPVEEPTAPAKLDKRSLAYFDRVAELRRSTDDPAIKRRCEATMAKFLGLDKSDSDTDL